MGECLCFGDDCSRGAAEQTKPASGADGPSSQLRAVNQGSVDWAVPVWWESLKGGIAWRCMLAQWSMLQCRCARCSGSAVRLESLSLTVADRRQVAYTARDWDIPSSKDALQHKLWISLTCTDQVWDIPKTKKMYPW